MERAYVYRLYPNKKQRELIQKTFGCSRFVYNYFLDLKVNSYKEEKKSISYYETCKRLTQLKQELVWLKEVDKDALQKSLKDLDMAYQNFFKQHNGFPKFKSKKDRNKSYRTSCTNNNIKSFSNSIQLPKLGKVRARGGRAPQGRILNATVSQTLDGKYYCSLCCTDVEVNALPKTNQNIGIDLGIVDFATLSNGSKIENPRYYEKLEKKLARLQREMSRKTIGGSNWNKARIKVARLQKHIANQREDFLNKLTTKMVHEYDVICIENLEVSEMKETDSKIRNKHVSDVSWYSFRAKLTYKCNQYGKQLIVIDRYYPSSQICNVCGSRDEKKTLDIRNWTCPHCGASLDRDVNAAINILNEGMRMLS